MPGFDDAQSQPVARERLDAVAPRPLLDRARDGLRRAWYVFQLATGIDLLADRISDPQLAARDRLDRRIAEELSTCLDMSITPEVDVAPMVRAKLMRARRGGDAQEELDGPLRNARVEVRVLTWLALLLPPDSRERFVEEVAAELAHCTSQWRRAGLLLSLAPHMPGLAWIMRRLRHRRRA